MAYSNTRPSNTRAGEARSLGELARNIAGRKPGRRTNQPVRRNSYDVQDKRAQRRTRFGDGTKAGGMRWRDKVLQTAEEFDVVTRGKGRRGLLQANGIRVLKAVLWTPGIDFNDAMIEPSIDTLARRTGLARNTVIAALKRLARHGFLSWVRRTEKTDNEGGFGPQVKQATNAYFVDLAELRGRAKRAWQRLMQLLGLPIDGSHLRAASADLGAGIANPELAAVIARLQAGQGQQRES